MPEDQEAQARGLAAAIVTAARSPLSIVLLLFVMASLYSGIKYPVSYGEVETLLTSKQRAEPDFLPGDWYLNLSQPVRVPYQILAGPFVTHMPMQRAAVSLRLIGYLLATTAIGLIAWRLGLGAGQACVVLGLFLWWGQSLLPNGEWILARTESKVIAYGLLLWGLYALIRGRTVAAAALGGLATTFHLLVGGWGSLALGATALSRRVASPWRLPWVAGVWALMATPALYAVLDRLQQPHVADLDYTTWLYVFFRNPHHLDPSYWHWSWQAVLGLAVALGIAALASRLLPDRDGAPVIGAFALWCFLPYAAGLAIAQTSHAASFLMLYPFRVASTVVLLAALLVGVPAAVQRVIRPQARPYVFALASLFFLNIALGNFTKYSARLDEFPMGGVSDDRAHAASLLDACAWVQANTERGERLLTSPRTDVVTYACDRPVVAFFRTVPSAPADLDEWYRRLVALNGGEPPQLRGYAARTEIDRHFRALTAQQYRDLGQRYEARYLLMRRRAGVGLPSLYLNADWGVYLLSGDSKPDPTEETKQWTSASR